MHLGLVAVVAVLIGGLAVTTAYGQASTTTFRDTFTFSDGRLNPCNGEFVSFDGTISFVSHFTNTPNGGTIINFNLQSTGHGQGDLGNTYNIDGNNHFKFISQPGAAELESTVDSIRVISQGSADNFILETIFKVTFNANGEPTHVDVEVGPGKCLGLPPPPNECTDCFLGHDEGGNLQPKFVNALKDFFDTEPIFYDLQLRSIADLCFVIDTADTTMTPVTEQEIRTLFDDPLLNNSPNQIQQIIDCLIELGLITPTP